MTLPWQADNGDGTYRNPVLYADWSDPDAVRVGDDYYLIASSFNRVPGLPILHSTDMVNWRLIGHALDKLVPAAFFSTPRHGCGVWAPALRHHDHKFWITYPDPDYGIYLITAPAAAGPWSEPRLVLPGRGLIDPCPLWDDDGNAYLVHGWARSRAGIGNKLTAYRMTPDLTRAMDNGVVIVDGDTIPGCRTLEGPKWYRRDGWYWIFAPAGGVATGWQYAMRSRSVLGRYEPRIVLAQGDTDVNGPHQGAWVDSADGRDWFLHFQDKGAYGRIVHLQPMKWGDDGWPVIGAENGTGFGIPVAVHRKPAPGPDKPYAPEVDDIFPGGVPGPQWTWQANPSPGWLLDRDGADGLRLACLPWPSADLREVPNVLGQRLPAPAFSASTGVRLSAPSGSRSGLVVLGYAYAWIGLERKAGGSFLACRFADPEGGAERDVIEPVPVPADARVRLFLTVADGAVVRFAAEVEGGERIDVGLPFIAAKGHWVGATISLFATAKPGTGAGHADFEPFLVA